MNIVCKFLDVHWKRIYSNCLLNKVAFLYQIRNPKLNRPLPIIAIFSTDSLMEIENYNHQILKRDTHSLISSDTKLGLYLEGKSVSWIFMKVYPVHGNISFIYCLKYLKVICIAVAIWNIRTPLENNHRYFNRKH